MLTSKTIADAFDIFNQVRLQSNVLENIWRQAYGSDYAAEARPDAFFPQSVLEGIILAAAAATSGNPLSDRRALLDIGCGHGLTGLYLAEQTGMDLMGIDVSSASIALAQKNTSRPDCKTSVARFWVTDASSTKLDDGACSFVTCLDVLLHLPDKLAIMKEIYRILAPGGCFAFTTWEQHGYNPRLGAQQVEDYRPLLKQAGFDIEKHDVVEGAGEQQRHVFDALVEREEALRDELGDGPASMFVKMGRSAREESGGRRYVFGLA